MNRFRTHLLATTAALIAALPSIAHTQEEASDTAPGMEDVGTNGLYGLWKPYSETVGRMFWLDTADPDKTYDIEQRFFVPLGQGPDWMLFADLRGGIFQETITQGTAGLAFRKLTDFGIFGVYGHVDVIDTEEYGTFTRGSIGAEYMTERLEARANLYSPLGGSSLSGNQSSQLEIPLTEPGDPGIPIGIRVISEFLEMPTGGNAEIGASLPFDFGGRETDFWLYGGGYYFDGDTPEA